jgi:hypothetical protein
MNLIGYTVSAATIDKQALVTILKDRLPDYMVPLVWVQLETLPLTASGKIDKRALPDPDQDALLVKTYTAPTTELEKQLTAIWEQLLKKDLVGVHDNFFELGGHSLLAMRVVSHIRKELSVGLSIRELFFHPTIAELTAWLQQQTGQSLLPAIELLPRPEHIPLSFSQERLWFLDRLEGSVQYHLPIVLRLKGGLNKPALQQALQTVIDRHEVLRTVFRESDVGVYQSFKEKQNWTLQIIEGSKYKKDAVALKSYIGMLINAPFDLSVDYPVRGSLIGLDESENLLVVTIHHIASDAWSISIIVKEVVELYNSFVEDTEPELATLPLQYADYAIWQRNYLSGELLDEKMEYWQQKLSGVSAMQLPTDFIRPPVRGTAGAGLLFRIDKSLSGQVLQLGQQQGRIAFHGIVIHL